MIMISVNNSAVSTGLRMNCRNRENKENQMDFLGVGWQVKKNKEASKSIEPLGHSTWAAGYRSATFLLELGRAVLKL